MNYGSGYLLKGNTAQSFDKLSFNKDELTTENLNLIYDDKDQAGFSSNNSGYSTGRYRILKLAFSNELSSVLFSTLSDNRNEVSGMESRQFGYTMGGNTNYVSSSIDKLYFDTDTNSLLDSKLSKSVKNTSSCTNLNSAGYTFVDTNIEKTSFISDSLDKIKSDLKLYPETCAFESIDNGYFFGSVLCSSDICKLNFFSDDTEILDINLVQNNRQNSIGVSCRNSGYIAGSNNVDNTIEEFDFFKKNINIIESKLSDSRIRGHGFENLPWQK